MLTNGFVGLGEFTPGDDEQMRGIEIVAAVSEECGRLPLWVHTSKIGRASCRERV